MSNPYAPPDPTKPLPPRREPPPGRPVGKPMRAPRPEQPKLEPEQVRSVTRGVMLFGLLMLLTLLAAELPVPWQLASPVLGVLTTVHGIRTVLLAQRLGWRGMLAPMLVAGIVLSCLSMVATTSRSVFFWDEQVAYQQCQREAITISAREQCDRTYQEAITPDQG